MKPRWWGTLLYVPVLFGLGWLASRPLQLLVPGWRADQVDLAGLVVSLLLLLLTLPLRLQRVWGERQPWQRLGVLPLASVLSLRALIRGTLKALLLLGPLTALLMLLGQARWLGDLGGGEALNALALVLGVGFAEELLFRGWLWGELELLVGVRRALMAQAGIFALLHPWYRQTGLEALALLGGLTLLGLCLALQRRADGGSLWGCVGLHGGLVGGWFALQNGLIEVSPQAPAWLVGAGGSDPNPIGGLAGITGLAILLWVRRRWLRVDQSSQSNGR